MSTLYDVIIAGCGPAGATAGLTLARQGLSVAMLDRARFPRKKLCGGLLTWKSIKLLEAVYGETPDSLSACGVINHVSDRYAIRTFDSTLAAGGLPYPFHFTDRQVLDACLLDRAKEAGAEVFEEVRVTGCDPNEGAVSLEDGRTLRGRYVLGADGANSVIRRSFPSLNRERLKRFMAPALEISMVPQAFPQRVECPELFVGFIGAGYGWVFPNRGKVMVGICGLRREGENFSKLFRSYLKSLDVDEGAIPHFHGHPLPYGNYLGNPWHGRAMLAGDAGGFVEPLFGEGIFYALCTGLYAGEALAEGIRKRTEPGPIYTRRLHRQVIPELRASDRLRWALFRAMRYAGPPSLGLFVNSAATRFAEMVHGIRSYSLLRKKRWDFLT